MTDRSSRRRRPSTPSPSPSASLPRIARLGYLLLLVAFVIALPRLMRWSSPQPWQSNEQLSDVRLNAPEVPESDSEPPVNPTPTVVPGTEDTPQISAPSYPAHLRESLELMVDKSLEFKPREMQAYWGLIRHVEWQDVEALKSQAISEPKIADFFLHPSQHRGELSVHEMTIRRVLPYESQVEPPASQEDTSDAVAKPTKQRLYEIWGSHERAANWLYVLITPELPEGWTPESCVGRKAQFVGYFLKLQGYFPAAAKTNDRANLAPLFIGRIAMLSKARSDAQPALRMVDGSQWLIGIAIAAAMGWFAWRVFSRLRPSPSKSADAKPDIDWLMEPATNPSPSEPSSKADTAQIQADTTQR